MYAIHASTRSSPISQMPFRGSQGTHRADPCKGYDGKPSPVPPVTLQPRSRISGLGFRYRMGSSCILEDWPLR